MDVFLIRHGIAADRSLYARDLDRPLTETGQIKTARIARRLAELGVGFDILLSSPYLRAQQTAKLLLAERLAPRCESCQALAPEGSWEDWVHWWRQWHAGDIGATSIALVGHQPNLGHWAEMLVWGCTKEKLTVKKAGIIGVRLPDGTAEPTAAGELFLLSAPKWLL